MLARPNCPRVGSRVAVLPPDRSILAGSKRGSSGWVSDLFTRRNVVSDVQRVTAGNTYEKKRFASAEAARASGTIAAVNIFGENEWDEK